MTSTPIKEFLVSLGFDVSQKGLGNFEQGIKKASFAVAGLAAAFAGVNLILTKFVYGVAKEYEALGNLSQRVNAGAEDIQRLGYIASLSGSSVDAVNGSLDNLNRMVGEASLGVGRGALIFKKLGISVKDSNGKIKQTTVVLDEVKKRLVGLEKSQQIALLGKIGIDPSLLKTLTNDVGELENEFNQLYQTIGIDSEKAIKQSTELNDEIYRTKFAFDLLRKSVVLEVMPQITRAFSTFRKSFVESLTKNKELLSGITKNLLNVTKGAVILFQRILGWVGNLVTGFKKLNDVTNGWAGYLLAALVAWRLLSKGIFATPLGRIIALGLAIAALVDDFLGWQNGDISLFDWTNFATILESMVLAGQALVDIFGGKWVEGLNKALKSLEKIDQLIEKILGKQYVGKLDKIFSNNLDEEIEKAKKTIEQRQIIPSSQQLSTVNNYNQLTKGNSSEKNIVFNQETKITVQGSADAMTTANQVAAQQSNVNRDLTRDFAGGVQ